MKQLAFERVPRSEVLVATDGKLRIQMWQELKDVYFGPHNRVRWGAAVFEMTLLGSRRITDNHFFRTRDEALAWLEKR
jgi:hypothetical protein